MKLHVSQCLRNPNSRRIYDSLAIRWNDEMGFLKRFFDGFKNALCGVIDFVK